MTANEACLHNPDLEARTYAVARPGIREVAVIEVDGGLSGENSWQVVEAGANAIVAGSHVFHAADYADAIASIRHSHRPRS